MELINTKDRPSDERSLFESRRGESPELQFGPPALDDHVNVDDHVNLSRLGPLCGQRAHINKD